ncbi:MAG: YebC/PmpR family DNA-binding transcriptional regulator [Gammaproteobacteria bacterium]|nr:YebC/PmpR family DNA-binding transcriptional regulator [Gammaproteobacteria bacterium]
MGRAFQNRKESMAKTANMKTKIYSKYGKEIYMVAKSGGVDPDGNLALRSLMDRAKKDQVPAHVIKNALDKAQGGAGEDYSPARYEGFGPGGCMVIVDCLTDNPNRTIMEVKNCFTKTNSKLGAPGSAAHMFDHLAIFVFDGDDEDTILEALMMADVDVTDVEVEDGKVTVTAPYTEFGAVKTALEQAFDGIDFDAQEISWEPQTMAPVAGDDVAVFEKFMNMLNDCEDVQDVYHNAELEQ